MCRFFGLTILSTLLLFISCSEEEKISFIQTNPIENTCNECPKVSIDIPQAQPATYPEVQKINTSIEDFAIAVINYTEDNKPDSLEAAVSDFNLQYKELKEKFPESIMAWEASIKGEVSYSNTKFVSLIFDSYVYTGGAHGYGSTSFLNYNLATGENLNQDSLFINTGKFTDFAEKLFREQKNLTPEANINSTGFMFENDRFHLPASIGFDKQGIILIYNPYEIASYADGQTKIHIPMEQAKSYIKPSWLDANP